MAMTDEALARKDHKVSDEVAIDIQTMNKWYGTFHVLRDIDLTVYRGERIVICGPSGSGKSTLAALAVSFLTPDQGRVVVDGVDLREVKLASYRSQLGLVLRDEFLFDGTIRENLLFPPPDAAEKSTADEEKTTELSVLCPRSVGSASETR